MLHIYRRRYSQMSGCLHQTKCVSQSSKCRSLKRLSFGVGFRREQAFFASSSSRDRPTSDFWIRQSECRSGTSTITLTLSGNKSASIYIGDRKNFSSRYNIRDWTDIDRGTGHRFEHLTQMAEAMSRTPTAVLEKLNFDNKAMKSLPVDASTDPRVRRQVSGACFTSVVQEPVKNPTTVALSPAALELLEISEVEASRGKFAEYFSGSKLLPGSEPAAHCYCGHQFGYFSGQLGDGAAM